MAPPLPESDALVLRYDEPRVNHAFAVCRWCQQPFVRMFGWQWICPTEACATRMLRYAVMGLGAVVEGTSPFVFLPLPLQVEIIESDVPNLLVASGKGASKSYCARWTLYLRCRAIAGYRALLLRCTGDQLYKNHLQYMDREAGLLGDAKYKTVNYRPQMLFENGSVILTGYCDDKSDIAQHLGVEYDEIVFEEAVTFLPAALNEISTNARGAETSRIARAQLGGIKGRTRLFSNPGGRAMNYLAHHYITRDPAVEDYPNYNAAPYGWIKGILDDNPYLEFDYIERNLSGLAADRYKQLRYGDWSVFAGQFFEFDPAVHVVDREVA